MDIPGRRFDFGKSLWTEWFDRGGDGIIVRAEALNWVTTSSLTLYIDVYSKKSTEPGDGSQVGSWRLTLSAAAGVQQAIYTSAASEASAGMYDMVRLKVSTNAGSAGDWIVARIFPPIFFDKAS